MKSIKIKFCDFSKDFNSYDNDITNILKEKYDVVISDNPDYVFYSTFGFEHMKYDCVRIYYTGECIVPDFNICDYAIGFDYLNYGDRYVRVPLYKLFHYRKELIRALHDRDCTEKTEFCSFVCSNDNGMKERKEIWELLNKYKKVSSGGRFLNNVGGPVKDKHKFQSKHKFSIAFENCVQIGYTTEKIVESFAAGTIPIYYGNPEISKEFNTNAFVNCHDYSSLEAVVDRIIEIDNNDELFYKILNSPITDKDLEELDSLRLFLFNIFDQEYQKCKRRPSNTYTREKESLEKTMAFYYKHLFFYIKRTKGFFRRLKNKSL